MLSALRKAKQTQRMKPRSNAGRISGQMKSDRRPNGHRTGDVVSHQSIKET